METESAARSSLLPPFPTLTPHTGTQFDILKADLKLRSAGEAAARHEQSLRLSMRQNRSTQLSSLSSFRASSWPTRRNCEQQLPMCLLSADIERPDSAPGESACPVDAFLAAGAEVASAPAATREMCASSSSSSFDSSFAHSAAHPETQRQRRRQRQR